MHQTFRTPHTSTLDLDTVGAVGTVDPLGTIGTLGTLGTLGTPQPTALGNAVEWYTNENTMAKWGLCSTGEAQW
jgi:hypothetical protein